MNSEDLQGARLWPIVKYIISICLEVLTKARNFFSYDTRLQGQVFEMEQEEYETVLFDVKSQEKVSDCRGLQKDCVT
jgi:hypothetical protein